MVFPDARFGKEFAATTLNLFVSILSAAQFFTLRWPGFQLPSTVPARSTPAGHVPGNLCRWAQYNLSAMTDITYTIGWDYDEFKVPGKIRQIASLYIDHGLTKYIRSVIKCKKLYVDILVCGHDYIGRINVSKYKKNNFMIAINAKRLFYSDLNSEAECLGQFVCERAVSGIKDIMDKYQY